MSILGKAIRNNIISGNNKYKNDEEKIGQVIQTNEPENTCTVSVITRDGISSIEYNVIVKKENWFPEVGDYVEVKEQFKRFFIVGPVNIADMNTNLEGDIYTDT